MNSSFVGRMPMRCLVLWCGLLALAWAPPALANAYKCRLPGGKIEISSKPCPEGSKTEGSQSAEVISPEQREAAEQKIKRDREFIKEREAARAAEAAREPAPPPPPPPVAAPAQPPAPTVVVVPGYGPGYAPPPVPPDPVSLCIAALDSRPMTSAQRAARARLCYTQPPSRPNTGVTGR